ncbi:roadblock/LC7 domain-containing protein [Nocardia sp. NPDC004068]|uniref:roadblock/LC7 domain-containing protein n=1 Tax=Nocardia sp. NPDC004068 TaxID=3364303 RepID=UPI0036B3FD41
MSRRLTIALSEPRKVADLLTAVCADIDDAAYAFLASRDGLVIAASGAADEASESEVALRGSALASAAIGIGDHFAVLSSHGRLQSTLFESERGCVGIYPMSSTVLLVVGTAQAVNLGRLSAAAKKIISALQEPNG